MSKLLHAISLLLAIILYRMLAPTPIPGGSIGNYSINSQIYLTTATTGLD
ncbi:hypothetical protein Lepto7375DRAFT_2596 [Leptolyngbya sp. PCC 7375]|nr:hypothetical protein Lepto7375DRAFT_2596 [Leptolyngbya sp. PCC 7375]